MDSATRLVVTISRQIGSGGAFVGQALAKRLGVRYLDREILQQAASVLGRDEGDLAPLEERVTGVWDRVAAILSLGAPEAPFVPPPLSSLAEDELFAVESQIMREVAAHESGVIVGRGGCWVLRDHPGVLRVFLHAPEAWRIDRIRAVHELPDAASAAQVVQRFDLQRRRFMQSLLGPGWPDPQTYDVCLNTASVGLDATADCLAALAAGWKGRQTAGG